MTEPIDGQAASKASAEQNVARLGGQIEAMRAVLIRLLQDVVRAENRLDSNQTTQLVAANEQLVVAALEAQSHAMSTAAALDRVARSAELDTLTQLPNRVLLLDRLTHSIATARRHGNRVALLFVDLDNFKHINDTLGHAVGDAALKLVAERLSNSVRAADTVSRHGGDEFLILLSEVAQPQSAGQIAEKVIAALGAPAVVAGHALNVAASIGISIYPEDGEDADALIERADLAMYRAKRQAPGHYGFYAELPSEPLAVPPRARRAEQLPGVRTELDRRQGLRRRSDEELVLSALSTQELLTAAEQAQRRQSDFVAVVANELRDPLAPIRIAAAMLGRVSDDDPLLPRVQAIVERQVAHISRLVGELNAPPNAHPTALHLDQVTVDMVPLLEAMIGSSRIGAAMRQQQVSMDLPAGGLMVRGDPVRLAQIVTNLLDNASRYTPDGGRFGLMVVRQGDAMVMTVSDSGIGITAQALPQVFDPFVQDMQALGFNGVGVGIGLTVVRALVQAHGGSVTAHSAGSGLGSQFIVTLPLIVAPAADGSSDTLPDPGPASRA